MDSGEDNLGFAAPDPTRTLPLLPEVDAPALNTSRPLAAPAPALDVPIRSAPPLPVVPSPEPARRVPPVSVELRPDSRLRPPPDPLVPLPAPSRVAPPRPDEAAPDKQRVETWETERKRYLTAVG